MNPYAVPAQSSSPPAAVIQWRRVLGWSSLIVLAMNLIGVLSALTMGQWQLYGDTLEEAVVNAALVRRLAYGLVGAALYWRFARGVRSGGGVHVALAFVLVHLIDSAFSFFAFGVPVNELAKGLVEPWSLLRSGAAALVGFGLARLSLRRSSRPAAG